MALTDFYIKQNDTAEPISIAAVYDDGTPVAEDFTGASVRFHMRSDSGTVLISSGVGSVTDIANRVVKYQWIAGDTAVASPSLQQPHQAEFQVTLQDGRVMTIPNASNISVHVFPEIA